MSSHLQRAIIVFGGEDAGEATLAAAERYDEVFIIARALPDANDHRVINGDRAENAARGRLTRALARLRAHGVRALGMIGDENAAAARADVRALFPTAAIFG